MLLRTVRIYAIWRVMNEPAELRSIARVRTASGSRYLQQLCKHWAHKFPVSFTPEHGEVPLPMGLCRLDAGRETLTIALSGSGDEAALAKLEQVVADHLKRFAFRENLRFDWVRA